MKVYLNEITEEEKKLNFTQQENWVSAAVEKVDEIGEGPQLKGLRPSHLTPHPDSSYSTNSIPLSQSQKKAPRLIDAHFSLMKVDNVFIVSGQVSTQIHLLCSRCANSFDFPCRSRFSSLFCKDPVMAGVAHLRQEGKPVGQNKGFARHAHDWDDEDDSGNFDSKDIDITYLSQDFIDLGDILTEQLQLQVPFQPLCHEDCKGICANCGADLNLGKCACSKVLGNKPFSALRDLKL